MQNFSTIELDVDTSWALCAQKPVHHDVTSDIPEDPIFADYVNEKLELLGPEYKRLLAVSTVDLDGRFLSIRTQETGLGNFMSDVCKLLSISLLQVAWKSVSLPCCSPTP